MVLSQPDPLMMVIQLGPGRIDLRLLVAVDGGPLLGVLDAVFQESINAMIDGQSELFHALAPPAGLEPA